MGKKLDDLRKRVKQLEKRLDAIDGTTSGKSAKSAAKKSAKSKSRSSKAMTIKKGGTRIKDTPAPVAPVA